MKANYVQLEKGKTGVKVTTWHQNLSYSESCRNVYLTKEIYKNGNKSTIPAFARVTGLEVPYILTANTYFWNPSSSSGGRRANETRRNGEIEEFMWENTAVAVAELNELFAKTLIKGEKIGADKLGAFLSYRNQEYHFDGRINPKSISEIRGKIRERRLNDLKNKLGERLDYDKLKKTFITIEDSTNSGNCPYGTKMFYNGLSLVKKGFRIRSVRADVLLKIRDDSYTRRAVNYAMNK